ncbi:MAG: Holliday junction resolvase RuvX [Desulfomonile sp.]|nr:Holliday junction resolvase RuvX [Desulfomonile sp.]
MRILGLDIGSKRIGVAVSDELGFTAQGVETLVRTSLEADLNRISSLVERYGISEIVVGIPFNMDGSEGPQARMVREMAEAIGCRCSMPVHEWDERLSTLAAERTLLEADVSRAKRRKVIDKLAAVIILQGFLDSRSFGVSA